MVVSSRDPNKLNIPSRSFEGKFDAMRAVQWVRWSKADPTQRPLRGVVSTGWLSCGKTFLQTKKISRNPSDSVFKTQPKSGSAGYMSNPFFRDHRDCSIPGHIVTVSTLTPGDCIFSTFAAFDKTTSFQNN